LGNARKTVSYLQVPHLENKESSLASVVEEMKKGGVDTVVLVGTNPSFTAQKLDFSSALKNVAHTIQLSDYVDESSKGASWHINRAHYLETWGDGFSYGGASSVIQPQIQPLYDGVSEVEFLNIIVAGSYTTGYDLVQNTFK